ncbi:MAG TPA: hypothetical protein PLR99_00655 [Polyangiaceae bacterium]|nr:hypothetical protein [Polyangiaceae bacterium]
MKSSRRFTSVLALTAALAALSVLHCAASDQATGAPDGTPESPGAASAPTFADGGAGDAPVPEPDPPPREAGVPNMATGVVLVNAHDTLPAFRLCPAVPSGPDAGASNVSVGTMLPLPTARMPGSSLAGVDARGAVLLEAPLEFDGKDFVLLLIDEATKSNEGLLSGACSALACDVGTTCLPAANRVGVRLRDFGLLRKAGTVLAVVGKSDTEVRVEERQVLTAPGSGSGALKLQLVNLSDFDGGVTYEALTETDAGVSARSTPLSPTAVASVSRGSYADRLKAGAHQETLLEVHESSNPSVPVADHFGSPGVYAVMLVGSRAQNAPKALKFLAIPTQR